MANQTDKTRYMMKFQFIRLDEPQKPEWNVESKNWNTHEYDFNENPASQKHQTTWRHVWNWMTGNGNGQATQNTNGNLGKHIEKLSDENPNVRTDAADEIGQLGEHASDALPALSQTLHDEYEPVRLNAAYALGQLEKKQYLFSSKILSPKMDKHDVKLRMV